MIEYICVESDQSFHFCINIDDLNIRFETGHIAL